MAELGKDPQWRTRRPETEEALRLAHKAKERVCSEIKPLSESWAKNLESEADALISSFNYFLSPGGPEAGYRFAAWIDHPRWLHNRIDSVISTFQEQEKEDRERLEVAGVPNYYLYCAWKCSPEIDGAIDAGADKLGYVYIATPSPLEEDVIDSYKLEFCYHSEGGNHDSRS